MNQLTKDIGTHINFINQLNDFDTIVKGNGINQSVIISLTELLPDMLSANTPIGTFTKDYSNVNVTAAKQLIKDGINKTLTDISSCLTEIQPALCGLDIIDDDVLELNITPLLNINEEYITDNTTYVAVMSYLNT